MNSTIQKEWGVCFLEWLAETGNVSESARKAGVHRDTPYKRRETDLEFSRQWDAAIETSIEKMELEARRRALHGTEKPVFYMGSECGHIREYSDTLMIFLLKAHRPEKYRENTHVTADVKVTHTEDAEFDELIAAYRGYVAPRATGDNGALEPSGVGGGGEPGQVADGAAPQALGSEVHGVHEGHRENGISSNGHHDATETRQE